MKSDKKATIKIQNISDDKKNEIISIINSCENNIPLPNWFKLKLENLNNEDLWDNEYLMNYNTWTNKVISKKWNLEDIKNDDESFEIVLRLNDRCNFSELISIISILGIDLNNVLIEDPYFGIYKPR